MVKEAEAAHGVRAHSNLVGGSTAERRIQCPASWKYEQLLPPDVDTSSVYAEEGTALHEAMEYMLENDITDPDEIAGHEFNGFTITRELIESALRPCLDFFDNDVAGMAVGDFRFCTELRCEFPGVPGAFGTSDIVARDDKRSYIIDWKFGAGVPVKAVYVDKADKPGEADAKRFNAQLMFYATAAMATRPDLFVDDDDWPVELIIVQPRSRHAGEDDPIYSHARCFVRDLKEFRYTLVKALAEAKGDNPTLRMDREGHCRFARCKAVCPKFTGGSLKLAQLGRVAERPSLTSADFVAMLPDLLEAAAIAEANAAEVFKLAHAMLEADDKAIPGWKLVPKRATEKYVDDDHAEKAVQFAMKQGVKPGDAYVTTPKTPAQLRAALEPFMEGKTKKARMELAKEELSEFTVSLSSGTTLARDEDSRPAVEASQTVVTRLADKLAALSA